MDILSFFSGRTTNYCQLLPVAAPSPQKNQKKRKEKKRNGKCLTRTTFLGPRLPFGARQIDPFAS